MSLRPFPSRHDIYSSSQFYVSYFINIYCKRDFAVCAIQGWIKQLFFSSLVSLWYHKLIGANLVRYWDVKIQVGMSLNNKLEWDDLEVLLLEFSTSFSR